jgi:hypothetical protein
VGFNGEELSTSPTDERLGARALMRLTARESATGRTDEVLAELGIALEDALIERTKLIFREPVGIRWEPCGGGIDDAIIFQRIYDHG